MRTIIVVALIAGASAFGAFFFFFGRYCILFVDTFSARCGLNGIDDIPSKQTNLAIYISFGDLFLFLRQRPFGAP